MTRLQLISVRALALKVEFLSLNCGTQLKYGGIQVARR